MLKEVKATLLVHKFEVALNPTYIIKRKQMFLLQIRQKCIKNKNFQQVVFKFLTLLQTVKNKVSCTFFDAAVAMRLKLLNLFKFFIQIYLYYSVKVITQQYWL